MAKKLQIIGSFPSGGGIGKETDPTVPEWAKQPQKPTYTPSEVGAQPISVKVTVEQTGATSYAAYISGQELKDAIERGAEITAEHWSVKYPLVSYQLGVSDADGEFVTATFSKFDPNTMIQTEIVVSGYLTDETCKATFTETKVGYTKDEVDNMSSGGGFVKSDTAPEDTSLLWVDPNDDSGEEASGGSGGGVWKLLNEVTVDEVVDSVTIDADSEGNAISAKRMFVYMYLPTYEYDGTTGTGYSTYAINGKKISSGNGYCYPASKWEAAHFFFDIMACGDLVYVRCYREPNGSILTEGRSMTDIFHFAINENKGLYETITSFTWSLFNRKVLAGSTFKVYGEVS